MNARPSLDPRRPEARRCLAMLRVINRDNTIISSEAKIRLP